MNDTKKQLSRVEKIGAERLTESYQTTPHFTVGMEVDAGHLLQRKRELSGTPEYQDLPLSLTAMLAQGIALCLRRHDHLNASFAPPDAVLLHSEVNIGVAVDTPRGLVVPVIKGADRLSLPELCAALQDLTGRARAGRLSLADITEGTFTLSNLGMLGVDWFTAIIDPPQSAILAVGVAVNKPVARPAGIEVRPVMALTLTCDHRVVDGAKAARFLSDVRTAMGGDSDALPRIVR